MARQAAHLEWGESGNWHSRVQDSHSSHRLNIITYVSYVTYFIYVTYITYVTYVPSVTYVPHVTYFLVSCSGLSTGQVTL